MSEEASNEEVSKRRMPEAIRKLTMRVQGGKEYLQVAHRLIWFRDECPDWGITTDLIEGGQEAGLATVKATIYNSDGKIMATAHKTETRTDFPAGWVEKAETSAIGRALALCGFGTQFTTDLDEGERFADSPQPSRGFRPQQTPRPSQPGNGGAVWDGPGPCPRCHAPMGKRHGNVCLSRET